MVHMVKFEGRSSMKKYIESRPMKWGSNFGSCVIGILDIFMYLIFV